MKAFPLAFVSLFFFASAFAEECPKPDEKVFVRPFVEKISQQLAAAVTPEGSTCSDGRCGQLPTFISINVGCNIPTSGQIVSAEGCKSISLMAYMKEFANSIAENGNAIITAPASYHVVFTDNSHSYDDVYAQIEATITKLDEVQDATMIKQALSEIKGVNRATFVRRANKLSLVTDLRGLRVGESIWRITPNGVQQDIYHSEEEYLVAFKNAGLICEEISRPSFFGELKWKMYNDSIQDKSESLGAAYINHNPFTIYHVKKVN